MRKGRDGEEWKKNGENDDENSGHYVVASRPPNGDRLQRRRSCQLNWIYLSDKHWMGCRILIYLFFMVFFQKLSQVILYLQAFLSRVMVVTN